ncbi:MAG: pimeloyl-CoA dehydrogenase large subunit [Rhizobiales bacterium 62-17]|nr:acyl-CoA dehydrogenase family protein [Hyphomicrobiales bacterium]OJY05880.1 MAG: pimeloyl-CoA dehydrogenase large subunit [Rhizobiales bacterium 62-17]
MDLKYPDEAQKFAEEVREFARAELPAAIKDKVIRHAKMSPDAQIYWQRKLCERGWACPGWPKQYGGPGFTPLQRHVFDNVMSEEGAPPAVPFGESMIAPVLFHVGSEAQKKELLPRIRTLEYWFCQGFSEPGAGSDLASLKTRAVRDGDEWVINGQKTWTSYAQFANMMFCLVRTDPDAKQQEGISMMVFPMSLPGITVRPIITMDGGHSVNETFFDNVRVPASSLIGEVNKGWTYAKLLLGHERTSIARIGQSKRELRMLKTLAADQGTGGASLLDKPAFRTKVAELEMELLALEITALRVLAQEGSPGVEANLLKIKGSEIQQTLTELLIDAVGPYALPFDPNRGVGLGNMDYIGPDEAAALGPTYLSTRVVTIYGGSNEIQRNIIAKSLGL